MTDKQAEKDLMKVSALFTAYGLFLLAGGAAIVAAAVSFLPPPVAFGALGGVALHLLAKAAGK